MLHNTESGGVLPPPAQLYLTALTVTGQRGFCLSATSLSNQKRCLTRFFKLIDVAFVLLVDLFKQPYFQTLIL